jgi:hypothetical protein
MSIRFRDVELLAPLLLKRDCTKLRLLTLGVQDCNFTLQEITAFFEAKGIPRKPLPPSQIRLSTAYKLRDAEHAGHSFIHQKTFFGLFGFSAANIQSLDLSNYEGADHVHDLNAPVPSALVNQFDCVFDGGTVEHVFSTKDALFNVARLVKLGGFVAHHSPLDWREHGFVNMTSKLYRTFYQCNGFTELAAYIIAEQIDAPRNYTIVSNPNFKRLNRPRCRSSVFVAFQKVAETPLRIPFEDTYHKLTGSRYSLAHEEASL